MIGPRVRTARASDAGELARLLSPLGYPLTHRDVSAVWEAWKREGNQALVAEDGERPGLIGVVTLHTMVVLHRPRPVGRITSLVVDARVRGTGLGRALVAAAEDALREAGCGLIEVTSHLRRLDAHRFYEHLGFERTSLRYARDVPLGPTDGPPDPA